MADLTAGWSYRSFGGVVMLRWDAWPSAPGPWLCLIPCAAAPDPLAAAESGHWRSWVEAQVAALAAAGDGIVVSLEVTGDPLGDAVAVVAVDGEGGGQTLLQRWRAVPAADGRTSTTVLALSAVADRSWPALEAALGKLMTAAVG